MGAAQGSDLNTDSNEIETTGRWFDPDGTGDKWVHDMIAHGPKAEDAAAATGDRGFPALAVRRDTAAAGSGTDGDYEHLQTDATGRLRVTGPVLEDAVPAAADGAFPVVAVRRDTAAAGSGTDGDYEHLSTDATGRLRTVATRDPDDALSVAASTAEADDLVVKASPGTLHSLAGYIASGEAGWIQVHDATAQPSNGAVPELSYYVGAATDPQPFNIPLPGHVCGTGIAVVWSTAGPTLTAGAAKMFVTAYYE